MMKKEKKKEKYYCEDACAALKAAIRALHCLETDTW